MTETQTAGGSPASDAAGTPTKRRVLFLCTGNAARSQIAEGWLRHSAADAFDVESAGTEPRREVRPLPMAVRDLAAGEPLR
jgi:protein-tyrosine-phosphatase